MKVLEGQKILVIRYGTNIITDCIEKYMEIESQYGYCWFGKLGTAPSQKVIQSVLSEECPKIICTIVKRVDTIFKESCLRTVA